MATRSPAVPRAADPSASLPRLAMGWASAAGATVRSTTGLALAEARLAAVSVPAMMLAAALSAAFLLGGWGLVAAALVYALIGLGLGPEVALTALGAFHFLVALLLWRCVERLSRNLDFSYTRRHLAGGSEGAEHDLDR